MEARQVHCPKCHTKLRVRDDSLLGKSFACPDCGEMLHLDRDDAGAVMCRLAANVPQQEKVPKGKARPHVTPAATNTARSASSPMSTTATTGATSSPERGTVPSWKTYITPQRIVWGIASLLGLAVIVWVATGGESTPDKPNDQELLTDAHKQPIEVPVSPDQRQRDELIEKIPATPRESLPQLPSTEQDELLKNPAALRLHELGELLTSHHERTGQFPASPIEAQGLPPEQRLGWLADVVSQEPNRRPDAPQPLWDRPFDDPLNSPFVRQRQERFLNPLFNSAGAQGFPATNFVGVAGVGVDAPLLAVDHPRAGVFGYDRRTTLNDITDGTSNTLLVVGLRERHAPWGSGGASTIRGLTDAPYVHGPDGFGTGQVNSMFVLMADGSVRQVSDQVDPLLVRRMAAMRDGYPLDPAVPGEPGTPRPTTTPPAGLPLAGTPGEKPPVGAVPPEVMRPNIPTKEVVSPDDRPISVPVAPSIDPVPPPDYDIERALAQKLSRYSQTKPAKVSDLLDQLEEMLNIPVNRDAVATSPQADHLEKLLTLDLRDTTLQQLLDTIAEKSNLHYTATRDQGIVIFPPGE
ncbi:MAG: hypothetical protein R3C01_11725 [Planctomycetaceae bacterium]